MKSLKHIILVVICFSLCASLCGCEWILNRLKVETEDLNGEDNYSLAVLGEDEICAEENVCYCTVFGLNPSGSKSHTDFESQHDADSIEAFAETPLSGVTVLQVTYGVEDNVTFTVECNRTKGNVRIVLLDENLNIVHDFDVAQKSEFSVTNAKGKEFEIRLAGESAEFTVNVTRKFASE